jgi:glyoxylase-like metal-dependent hydrolase (beta-lactamase superfamily II)
VSTHPAYGTLREVTSFAAVLLEDNPGTMTLDGTNSWVLRGSGASASVVVDPGEDDPEHLDRLAAHGPVELILLTHHHFDHTGGAARFAALLGAPVRALRAELCRGAAPLAGGETVSAAGLAVDVLHTPGHTDDSVCLRVRAGAEAGVLTGDTILGRGTTVLSDLGAYLDSLHALAAEPAGVPALPGHGPDLPDLRAVAGEYLAHRRQRLAAVRDAASRLGSDPSPREVVEIVYADVDPALWAAADESVRAQLEYLRSSR